MNRRTAIRNVILLSAGAALLPSCSNEDKTAADGSYISESDKAMLAAICEAILPKTTNFIGSSDLKSHEFVLTMVNDCQSPEERRQFISGMNEFAATSKEKMNGAFSKSTPEKKKAFLQLVEKKQDIPEAALKFYETTRRYTLQSFTSSKEYMTDIRNYKMVPGPNFKGCVPA
jgi:hypothetical protein